MKRSNHGSHALSDNSTITDVAQEAGVSIATVSRVLSGADPVRDKARLRVLRAIKKLDYQPNRIAQGLRAGKRKVIGVIVPDLQNPFFTSLVHGVEAVLCSAGYTMLLGNSDGMLTREKAQISVLHGEGVAGLILIPSDEATADHGALALRNIPTVAVDRIPTGLNVDFVCTNNRESAREAVNHLLSHGYRNIGFINGPKGLGVAIERMLGYEEALQAAGIPMRDSLVIHSDFRQAGGMKAMSHLLNLPKPPRAVLVANSLMSLGALQTIHEHGLRIPDDIAVIGFDDMPWAVSLRPPLTALAQPTEELGRISAELLLDRLKNPNRTSRRIIIPSRLVVRASCGAHRG